MLTYVRHIIIALVTITATACMEWDYGTPEHFDFSGRGLFILNEGNFQYLFMAMPHSATTTPSATA